MANYDELYSGSSVDILHTDELTADDGTFQAWRVLISDHGTIDFSKDDEPEKLQAYIMLAGIGKALALSKTNYSRLRQTYGDDCDAWIGKTIILNLEKHTFGRGGKWIVVYPNDSARAVSRDYTVSAETKPAAPDSAFV